MRPVQAKAINYLRPDIDPNMRLYVAFNEGVGSIAKDYSQYGNHAVLTDVEWGIGVNGNAGVFNGVSSFANCGNHPSLNITDAITIEAKVKLATVAIAYQGILHKRNPSAVTTFNYLLYLHNGNVATGHYNASYRIIESTTSPISANNFYHIVYTYNKTNQIIYVNGVNIKSKAETSNMLTNTFDVWIGEEGAGNYFNGAIDEVMIYNLGLSGAQNAADCYEVVCNA